MSSVVRYAKMPTTHPQQYQTPATPRMVVNNRVLFSAASLAVLPTIVALKAGFVTVFQIAYHISNTETVSTINEQSIMEKFQHPTLLPVRGQSHGPSCRAHVVRLVDHSAIENECDLTLPVCCGNRGGIQQKGPPVSLVSKLL